MLHFLWWLLGYNNEKKKEKKLQELTDEIDKNISMFNASIKQLERKAYMKNKKKIKKKK
jgi:hypothetical protein